ncbi:hypothetical protein HID58_091587 [Brassica napus]|uniref:Uncharacterized protein n=1 Tax=Brassica napus TaxID=3708 RepID=A0ABQ7X1J2_BRANA|nr:hypothetical protein HID58_091587 [Brassica napus]
MEFCFGQIIHLCLSHLISRFCLPFSPQESERTTVRVGRNLRERGVSGGEREVAWWREG